MPSSAPAMPTAGPITSAGWSRLQPAATRARTPGTAALAGSDCLPRSISPHLSLVHFLANAGSHACRTRPHRGLDRTGAGVGDSDRGYTGGAGSDIAAELVSQDQFRLW